MSLKILHKVGNFLKLVLNTSADQVKALFYTLTPLQTAAVCEIIFNIQKLPLTRRVVKELLKRKVLFKKLADKEISIKQKLAIIQNHYKQVQHTLLLVKRELLSLLE